MKALLDRANVIGGAMLGGAFGDLWPWIALGAVWLLSGLAVIWGMWRAWSLCDKCGRLYSPKDAQCPHCGHVP